MQTKLTRQYNEKNGPHLFVKTADNCKAACKCTGFVHCTSSQHVELNKLSAFENAVERCWVLLSQIWNWSNFSLNTAQDFLRFVVIHVWLNKVASAFAQQRSTCYQHVESTLGAVPSVSKDSQPWFNISLCEIFGIECSTCWVVVEVIWTPRSTTPQQTLNMLRACTVDKSSAFARCLVTDIQTSMQVGWDWLDDIWQR